MVGHERHNLIVTAVETSALSATGLIEHGHIIFPEKTLTPVQEFPFRATVLAYALAGRSRRAIDYPMVAALGRCLGSFSHIICPSYHLATPRSSFKVIVAQGVTFVCDFCLKLKHEGQA